MDSLKEITNQEQVNQKILQHSSNEERKPCPHGTMCMIDDDGDLCLWECSSCERERQEKAKEMQQFQAKMSGFKETMNPPYASHSNIPKRFIDKTVVSYQAKTKEQKQIKSVCLQYIQKFNSIYKKGSSLVFCGKPGTGKTHLAYGIINALQKRFITAALISAADMTSAVKAAYKNDYGDLNPQEIVSQFSRLDLLVLDEVGVQVDSDAEKRIFFDVMNKRYEDMRPTILMSNLTMEELTAFIGERIIDRMRENGGLVFSFDWESFR